MTPPCGEGIMELKSKIQSPFFWLYLAAVILLFCCLGTGSIINSEGRWFAIAREMMQTGDYLHPSINGQPYFDKPLVSYWLICLFSLFTGGVTAWSARIPSALAALLTLFCTVRITHRLFSKRAALWGGWVLLTAYSFAYWGRSAEADMEQIAAIMGALAVYFAVREKRTVWSYLLFWSICAAGVQTKGLGAIILPAGIAGIDMLVNRTVKSHLNWKNLLGVTAGIAIYAVPFLLESLSRKNYDASGIELVFRENIVRVFNPWDHKSEPFWIYLKHLPRLLIPWTPVFILALARYVQQTISREKFSREKLWLLGSIALIFLLFSASRSRRVYYILPAVPFCAMLCGVYLSEHVQDWTGKITRLLLKIIVLLMPVIGTAALCAPLLLLTVFRNFIVPAEMQTPRAYFIFALLLPVFGLAMLVYYFRMKDKENADLGRVFAGLWLVMTAVQAVAMPLFGADPAFRTERRFCEEIHELLTIQKIPAENVAFWGGDYSSMVYYLKLERPARLYSVSPNTRETRTFFNDTVTCFGIDDFRKFIARAKREGGAVLLRRDTAEQLRKQHPDLWGEFFQPDGTFSGEVLAEPASMFQLKFVPPEKMHRVMRKKMLLRIYPVFPRLR